MIKLYLILPERLEELKVLVEKYRNANNEPLFKVTGMSHSLDSFYQAGKNKQELDATIILMILEEDSPNTYAQITELIEWYKEKHFYFIVRDKKKIDPALDKNNSSVLATYKQNAPLPISALIKGLVDALNNGGKVKEEASKEKVAIEVVKKLTNYEIGLMGVERGLGVTHTTIMMAKVYNRHYKVAVIELHDHQHFSRIFGEKKGDYCKSNGIDFFYDVDYPTFNRQYKSKYDVILVDYGSDEDLYDMDEYIRNNRCCVIGHGSDWKIDDLKNFIAQHYEHDPLGEWYYLIPFTSYKSDMKRILDQKFEFIPYTMNPFEPEEAMINICDRIIS